MEFIGFIDKYDKDVAEAKEYTEVLNRRNYSLNDLDNITCYLKQGVLISAWMGIFTDIFNNKDIDYMGYYTDGVHIWPGYFPYYIENYDMYIPVGFLEFINERDYCIDNRSMETIKNNLSFYEEEFISKLSNVTIYPPSK